MEHFILCVPCGEVFLLQSTQGTHRKRPICPCAGGLTSSPVAVWFCVPWNWRDVYHDSPSFWYVAVSTWEKCNLTKQVSVQVSLF